MTRGKRLLLGDWSLLVRDPLDLLRLSLIVGTVVYFTAGSTRVAVMMLAAAALAVVARIVNLPRPFDAGFLVALSLHAWGEASGAYEGISWYDHVVHVALPMLSGAIAYIGFVRLEVLPDPPEETSRRRYLGVFLVTTALGLSVGAIWEIAEWTSDTALGTTLQKGNTDTVGDLMADAFGAMLGGLLLVLWTACSWGTMRRVSAAAAASRPDEDADREAYPGTTQPRIGVAGARAYPPDWGSPKHADLF